MVRTHIYSKSLAFVYNWLNRAEPIGYDTITIKSRFTSKEGINPDAARAIENASPVDNHTVLVSEQPASRRMGRLDSMTFRIRAGQDSHYHQPCHSEVTTIVEHSNGRGVKKDFRMVERRTLGAIDNFDSDSSDKLIAEYSHIGAFSVSSPTTLLIRHHAA